MRGEARARQHKRRRSNEPSSAELAAADAGARGGTPISEGDVAEMREFLRGFHGDINALLATR